MTFPDISPYVLGLHWHMIGIRWYALAYVAGILLGWRYLVLLVRNARLWGGHPPTLTNLQIDDLVLWITAGVIVGGRLGYVLFYMLPDSPAREALLAAPWKVFFVWEGGMSFHGGLIGVILAVYFYARSQKIGVLRLGDAVAPAVPIGMFFGRIANFINGELWGRPTEMPWGMIFCNKTIEAANGGMCPADYYPRHPSQIYEALLEGVLTFVVLRIATHKGRWLRREGAIVGLFLVVITACRIFVEFFRNPDAGFANLPLGLTMGQILSTPILLIGLWLMWRGLKRPMAAEVEPAAVEARPAEAKLAKPAASLPATPKAKGPTKPAAKTSAAKTPARKPTAKKPPAKPK
ncbi:MAG: prolipoprotein diacylglyceryl transferase [Caulobacteraceae bacterium]|nr:prolipoprotein diacylglyceryl transferase [Caulobacteraceae bacterium]